ncbi:SMP-30/gluconolactonase/LRE family protein [Streptodolium elevatio]|uniref:SMP-30/gluconolactonase/LRE family protein n=1 Tax=Streptodolium elevatio TaxID=3157996 RepID=A0ABV3DE17_9ACTN
MIKRTRRLTLAAALLAALAVGGAAVVPTATADPGGAVGGSGDSGSVEYADYAGDTGYAGPAAPASGGGHGTPPVIRAELVSKVAPLDPPSPFGHLTVLEGPAFGPDGRLYFVNLTGAPGQPKILKFDLPTKAVTPVHADATSGYSSLQFSPADGKIYATDFHNGEIDRLNPDGSGFETVFAGPVAGRPMVPDDIAFDKAGNMYITDYHGTPWSPTGRVVRLDADGTDPIVLQDGLSGPNGITFTPDFTGVWVSEYSLGRENHFALAPDGKSFTDGRVGMSANIGLHGFDSNTVDAAGNVYQVVIGTDKILVWNQKGDLIATVVVPYPQNGKRLVSNLAIKPGTNTAYVTVGGDDGGYIYRFRTLAPGIPQSNGGGA